MKDLKKPQSKKQQQQLALAGGARGTTNGRWSDASTASTLGVMVSFSEKILD
jgi:hypothetical protein